MGDARAPDLRQAFFGASFALAVAFHLVGAGQDHTRSIILAVLWGATAALWVRPRSSAALALLAGAVLYEYVGRSPVASNHHLFLACIAAVIVGAAGWQLARTRSLTGLYDTLAPPGRWLIVPLYVFGTWHKINTDFLDPDVSCAVALWDRLVDPIGLDGVLWMQYAAIYGTFVVEIVAMLLLLSPRHKLWGMLVGVPFHVLVGWATMAFYMDFSVATLAVYALFLPRDLLDRVRQEVGAWAFPGAWAGFATIVALGCGGAYLWQVSAGSLGAFGWVWGPEHFASYGPRVLPGWMVRKAAMFPLFTAYVGAAMALIVAGLAWRIRPVEGGLRAPAPVLLAVPALYFVNCLAPYVGGHTEHTLAMYSNLRTEEGRSNHLFLPVLPEGFGYQRHVARRIRSNLPGLRRSGPDRAIVTYELGRALRRKGPDGWATFDVGGTRYDTRTMSADERQALGMGPAGPVLSAVLRFRVVDGVDPVQCRH